MKTVQLDMVFEVTDKESAWVTYERIESALIEIYGNDIDIAYLGCGCICIEDVPLANVERIVELVETFK
ncbi:hypothetical protein HOU78_gp54 [Vibrio phage 1.204.O._10N.222.46.F12]|uniref:Uncharacterized protein n=1 Tax=Vibrio phage 1.204.O._10N.222.46.F12 TaxID=1881263 RepID=A0A2I7RNR0_9CAUD|nr:hypothetical protein HOU78_gp54 [Vibrio phage 1.204.O._10N.222.46.F12]AUR95274.1 hypothetical protein NVP1204O_54 [Vibrio phage 1.204.O._10N.222.46.F12]